MPDVIAFTIPGEPFAKGRPRAFGRIVYPKSGKPFVSITVTTPPKTREGETRISKIAKAIMAGRPPIAAPIRLRVLAVFEPRASWSKRARADAVAGRVIHTQKPDWDNLGKVTDALNGIVFTDDSLITDAIVSKRWGFPARMEISVEPVNMEGKVLAPSQTATVAKEGRARAAAPDDAQPALFASDLDARDE